MIRVEADLWAPSGTPHLAVLYRKRADNLLHGSNSVNRLNQARLPYRGSQKILAKTLTYARTSVD